MDFVGREVSSQASEALEWFCEQYADDAATACRDPFDILAEIEEELGHPLYCT